MRHGDFFALEPGLTFLNHGSFGACPRPVLATQSRLRERIEANPVTFLLDEAEARIDASRARLAGLIGADPDGLVFVPNATTGVNTVLASLRLDPGDEIVTINQAYNACANAMAATAERSGVRLVVADVPFPIAAPTEAVEAVLRACSDRTRFALVDHVTSATGLVLPVAELVAALESRGVAVMVDGAHAPGMVPLDLNALGASYYTGNCHKWLCAPKGAAFLHVRDDRRDAVQPLVVSHGRNLRRPGRSAFHDAFDWPGTVDPTPWICVGEAIDAMEERFGPWSGIMAANRDAALRGRRVLLDALGLDAPAPDAMIGSLATVPLPPSDEPPTGNRFLPNALQVRLRERHRIEVPIVSWPSAPERAVRIAMQQYNDPGDVERLVAALRDEGVVA